MKKNKINELITCLIFGGLVTNSEASQHFRAEKRQNHFHQLETARYEKKVAHPHPMLEPVSKESFVLKPGYTSAFLTGLVLMSVLFPVPTAAHKKLGKDKELQPTKSITSSQASIPLSEINGENTFLNLGAADAVIPHSNEGKLNIIRQCYGLSLTYPTYQKEIDDEIEMDSFYQKDPAQYKPKANCLTNFPVKDLIMSEDEFETTFKVFFGKHPLQEFPVSMNGRFSYTMTHHRPYVIAILKKDYKGLKAGTKVELHSEIAYKSDSSLGKDLFLLRKDMVSSSNLQHLVEQAEGYLSLPDYIVGERIHHDFISQQGALEGFFYYPLKKIGLFKLTEGKRVNKDANLRMKDLDPYNTKYEENFSPIYVIKHMGNN